MRFFFSQTRTTATLTMVYLLLPPQIRCDIAGVNWSCMIPHTTTNANCQKLRVFSLHRLSQRNLAFCGTLIALGTKVLSSSSSYSVLFALLSRNPVFLRIPPEILSSSGSELLHLLPTALRFPFWNFSLAPAHGDLHHQGIRGRLPPRPIKHWFLAYPFPLLFPASTRLLLFTQSHSTGPHSSPPARPASFSETLDLFISSILIHRR